MSSINPQDNGNIRFFLVFNRTLESIEIDIPDGFQDLELEIKQDFAAREIHLTELKLKFVRKTNILGHGFSQILDEYKNYGFETDIMLKIEANGSSWFDGVLDFASAETDFKEYIDVSLELNSLRKLVKEREKISIDLLSETNIDNNPSDAIVLHDATLRASLIDFSIFYNMINLDGSLSSRIDFLLNDPDNGVYNFPIHGLLNSPYENFHNFNPWVGGQRAVFKRDNTNYFIGSDFTFDTVNRPEMLEVGEWMYANGYYQIKTTDGYGSNFRMQDLRLECQSLDVPTTKLRIHYSILITNFSDDTFTTAISGQTIFCGGLFSYVDAILISKIEDVSIPPNSILTLVMSCMLDDGNGDLPLKPYYTEGKANLRNANPVYFITAETEAQFPDSNLKVAKIKSVGDNLISKMTNGFGLFNAPYLLNRYADVYLTNGFFIRQFTNKPFEMKFEDYKKGLQGLFNVDFAINGNTIFAGNYRDFFENSLIWEFDLGMDNEIIVKNDNNYHVNTLELKYESYEQDDKNSTIDSFLTESEWVFNNKKVGKSEKRDITFIADGRNIEEIRRDGAFVSPTKSKTEDDKIYVLDMIKTPDLVNRFNEGFTDIAGITRVNKETNLRFSFARILYDNYAEWLNEIGFYYTGAIGKAAKVKVNKNLTSVADLTIDTYQGLAADNLPIQRIANPLTKPILYEFEVPLRLNFVDAIELFDRIVNQRGFVRFNFPSQTLDLYPCDGTVYNLKEKSLKFVGKPKYE